MNRCAHCKREAPTMNVCLCGNRVCDVHAWYVVVGEYGPTQAVKCLACRHGWSKR